uniref:Glycylpeptide N-tetradecanoyltransferase n=1 Tax=Strongyloides papillosus TaxID=174720 RepID=A0A0N5CE43_STREA
MCEKTKIHLGLNDLWRKYPNIFQYNTNNARRLIVGKLIENYVEDEKVCPHHVLHLLFQDKEMVNLIKNKKYTFKLLCKSSNYGQFIYLTLLVIIKKGKKFRGGLGDIITNMLKPPFYLKTNEEVSKFIENVLIYVCIRRSRLRRIDNCNIVLNFLEFNRIHTNLIFDAVEKEHEKDYRPHIRPIKDYELRNYEKLI